MTKGPKPGSPEAKRGGAVMREKYGSEFFRRVSKTGGESVKADRSIGFLREIGRKGGTTTKERHGSAHFARIGKLGAERQRAGESVGEQE